MSHKSKLEIFIGIEKCLHSKNYGASFTINDISRFIKSNWRTTKDAVDILYYFGIVRVDVYKNETLVTWVGKGW